jgi:hypothetical protein
VPYQVEEQRSAVELHTRLLEQLKMMASSHQTELVAMDYQVAR